jgi:hypothetical protein
MPMPFMMGRADSMFRSQDDEDVASSGEAWELPHDATLKVEPSRGGLCVRALSGTLLVTQSGDPNDHVLTRGEVFRPARRGVVVVWALSAGAVRLSEGA